jgi:hypothetical protein
MSMSELFITYSGGTQFQLGLVSYPEVFVIKPSLSRKILSRKFFKKNYDLPFLSSFHPQTNIGMLARRQSRTFHSRMMVRKILFNIKLAYLKWNIWWIQRKFLLVTGPQSIFCHCFHFRSGMMRDSTAIVLLAEWWILVSSFRTYSHVHMMTASSVHVDYWMLSEWSTMMKISITARWTSNTYIVLNTPVLWDIHVINILLYTCMPDKVNKICYRSFRKSWLLIINVFFIYKIAYGL